MSNKQLQSDVRRAWRFGNTLLHLAEQKLFLTVLVADCNRKVIARWSAWGGGENPNSRAPRFGPAKADELLNTIGYCPQNPIALTPVKGYQDSTGLRGGIRVRQDSMYFIVTASGWSDDCDLLFASLVMYKLLGKQIWLHHVGFRHTDPTELQEALSIETGLRKTQPVYAPTDHERYYYPLRRRKGKNVLWREEQYDPSDPSPGVHWDFFSDGKLLQWLSDLLGVEPELWEAGASNPFGLVKLLNRNNVWFSVMERLGWSTVEEWTTVKLK